MIILIILLSGAAVAVVVESYIHTKNVKKVLQTKTVKKHFPLAMRTMVMVVQAGELLQVVQHTTPTTIAAALLLLTMVIATRSGTETFMD